MNRPRLAIAVAAGIISVGCVIPFFWPEKVSLLAHKLGDRARHQNRERWYQESHKPPPTLLEIRTAAENGDAGAQYTLAQVYVSQQEFAQAVAWYRRAAEGGNIAAQYELGETLLHGHNPTATSAAVDADADDAVLWLGKAANQGSVPAQIELAGCYQRGAGVDANLIESYKWFTLADRQSNTVARIALEHLELQMNRDDIALASRAARNFAPSADGSLPEPAYLQQLRLKGLSVSGKKRLAIVNNRTLAESEQTGIKLGSKTMDVRCLMIDDKSVLVQVGPFRKRLKLGS